MKQKKVYCGGCVHYVAFDGLCDHPREWLIEIKKESPIAPAQLASKTKAIDKNRNYACKDFRGQSYELNY